MGCDVSTQAADMIKDVLATESRCQLSSASTLISLRRPADPWPRTPPPIPAVQVGSHPLVRTEMGKKSARNGLQQREFQRGAEGSLGMVHRSIPHEEGGRDRRFGRDARNPAGPCALWLYACGVKLHSLSVVGLIETF